MGQACSEVRENGSNELFCCGKMSDTVELILEPQPNEFGDVSLLRDGADSSQQFNKAGA